MLDKSRQVWELLLNQNVKRFTKYFLFLGDLLIHSLPELKRQQLQEQCMKKEDMIGISTFVFTPKVISRKKSILFTFYLTAVCLHYRERPFTKPRHQNWQECQCLLLIANKLKVHWRLLPMPGTK